MHRFTQNFERRTSYHFAMCQFQSHVVNKFQVFSEQNSRMLSHRDMIICGVVHNLFSVLLYTLALMASTTSSHTVLVLPAVTPKENNS